MTIEQQISETIHRKDGMMERPFMAWMLFHFTTFKLNFTSCVVGAVPLNKATA
jgi:hypothetical protein